MTPPSGLVIQYDRLGSTVERIIIIVVVDRSCSSSRLSATAAD